MEKVFLEFDEQFWSNRQWQIVTNKRSGGASSLFFNYNLVIPESNILLCFIARQQLIDLGLYDENNPNDPIEFQDSHIQVIIRDLVNVGFDPNEHELLDWKATNWFNNKHYGGSWEYWPVDNGDYVDFDQAIQPVERLYKGGTAHCRNFWGFTWAAIMSGLWNAQWIDLRRSDPTAEAPYTPCEVTGNFRQVDFRDWYASPVGTEGETLAGLFAPP